MQAQDFFEGVRAVVIDKDNTPAWRPDSLEAVSEAAVAAYFAPLPDGELTFD
jgi:enoyl-CoA hydratase